MDPDIQYDKLLTSAGGRRKAWDNLKQDDLFFVKLCDLVEAGRVPEDAAESWMHGCEKWLGKPTLAERARLLVRCAVEASKPGVPSSLAKAMGGIAAKQQDVAAINAPYEVTWRLIATSQLRRVQPIKTVQVDFATYDVGAAHAAGKLSRLELSLWPNGSGIAVHHPRDCLATNDINGGFFESMEDAWHAAFEMVRDERTPGDELPDRVSVDGTWRVLDEHMKPMSQVGGRSASGAAVWGWYHLMRNQRLDDRVIVLCQVRAATGKSGKHYELASVDGIEQKTRAVAQTMLGDESAARFDTIAVVGTENSRQACDTLHGLGKAAAIRVLDLESEHEHSPSFGGVTKLGPSGK
jgi:hypothetical protein